MRTSIWSATCAVILLGVTVGVLAQDPQTPATQSSATSITVTGCVQKAQQNATGTSGSSGAAMGTETKFVLTSAALSTPSAAGTSGASTPPSTAIASEYRLDATDAKLSAHVGHKVEITGTVEKPTTAEQPPPASAANSPILKVDKVKMLASTCQAQ
jgi:hypothetical protein